VQRAESVVSQAVDNSTRVLDGISSQDEQHPLLPSETPLVIESALADLERTFRAATSSPITVST